MQICLRVFLASLLLSAAACVTKPPAETVSGNAAAASQSEEGFGNVGQAAPVGIAPGSARDFAENVGNRVLFAYDRADIDAVGRDTLTRQAAWLQRYPSVVLIIEGHADERGTREYNLALAARRAAAIRNYLTSLGVAPSRLNDVSYGKERPECAESTEICWQQNRRGVSTIRDGANT